MIGFMKKKTPNPQIDISRPEYYETMKEKLAARVGLTRAQHSQGVADMAQFLAEVYGYEPVYKARLAGLLHDWDKGQDAKKLLRYAKKHHLKIKREVRKNMPWLLHGPCAAHRLHSEFPELGDEICSAIAKHTCADITMSELDKIIYIADLIEQNRSWDGVDEFRALVGQLNLDALYFECYRASLLHLISSERSLDPASIKIWNSLVRHKHKK